MKMQVPIDVIHGQAGGAEFLELSMDFGAEFLAQIAFKKIAEAELQQGFRKIRNSSSPGREFFRLGERSGRKGVSNAGRYPGREIGERARPLRRKRLH